MNDPVNEIYQKFFQSDQWQSLYTSLVNTAIMHNKGFVGKDMLEELAVKPLKEWMSKLSYEEALKMKEMLEIDIEMKHIFLEAIVGSRLKEKI